jgi:hypothetical protein
MTVPSSVAGSDPLAPAAPTSRTERALCSMLHHLLLVRPTTGQKSNLERFLQLVNDSVVAIGEPALLKLDGFDPDLVDLLVEPAT